jgi:hypothetical protein
VRKALIRSSVLALAVLGAMSGCGKSSGTGSLGPASPGASTPAAGTSPPSLPGTGGPTPSSSGGGGGGGGGGNGTPTYPSTELPYVVAMLNAWTARDHTRQDQLAVKQAFDFLPRVETHWHTHACNVPDGSLEDCVFDNNVGDRLTVVVDPTKLGKPQAIQSASIDRTTYDTSVDGYVNGWISAWQDDNRYRMIQLSTSSLVTTMLNGPQPAPNGAMTMDTTGAPNGYTWVTVSSVNHDTFTLQVNMSLLGKAHAISAAPAG